MTSPLGADPDVVDAGADQLRSAAESVRATFEQFQAAAAGHAGAFGGDDIGMLLGTAHQACLDAVAECFTTNIVDLEDYADSLRRMAANLRTADEDGAAVFGGILGRLG